jgi:hypothetical protein
MFADSKLLVKTSQMEVMEMTVKELLNNKNKDNIYVFGMLYVSGGVAYDFVSHRQIKVRQNNGSGLYRFTYETPDGIRNSIICDANTEVLAGGENYYNSLRKDDRQLWSSFTSIFNVDDCVYIYDITGRKCKMVSLEKLNPSEEPEEIYFIKTKTKNVFANGILVKCR